MKEKILNILKEYQHVISQLAKYSSDLAITDDQFEDVADDIVKILNGEIRESCGEFCNCQDQQDNVSTRVFFVCGKCRKLILQNSQERT